MIQRKPFKDLLNDVNGDYSYLTYYELLSTTEWEERRQQIINRDNCICQKCNKGDTIKIFNEKGIKEYYWVTIPNKVRRYRNTYIENDLLKEFYIIDERDFTYTKADTHSFLHVHHQYYIKGTLPWDYEDDCFLTLCVHCHFKLHETETIPVYIINDDGSFDKIDLTPCYRCHGAGILPQFDYYMGGICFRCFGAKFEQLITDKLKKKSSEIYARFKNMSER